MSQAGPRSSPRSWFSFAWHARQAVTVTKIRATAPSVEPATALAVLVVGAASVRLALSTHTPPALATHPEWLESWELRLRMAVPCPYLTESGGTITIVIYEEIGDLRGF